MCLYTMDRDCSTQLCGESELRSENENLMVHMNTEGRKLTAAAPSWDGVTGNCLIRQPRDGNAERFVKADLCNQSQGLLHETLASLRKKC